MKAFFPGGKVGGVWAVIARRAIISDNFAFFSSSSCGAMPGSFTWVRSATPLA